MNTVNLNRIALTVTALAAVIICSLVVYAMADMIRKGEPARYNYRWNGVSNR